MNIAFPDRINVALPEGVRAAVEQACAIHGISLSDYMREAVAIALGVDGIDVPPALQEVRPNLAFADRTAYDGSTLN